MSYQLVDALQKEAIPVHQCCRVLEVSRSGFYAARRRLAKPLFCKTSVHLRAAFMASHQSYGSRRMVTAMKEKGITIGRYKVRQLMQKSHLKPVWKRKFIHTTDSKHDLPIAENILARQFNPVAPNVAYVSDITYIRTGAGWLYLATVLDLVSRKVVGWAMAQTMSADLVCEALNMAISHCSPAQGPIVHSDRGSHMPAHNIRLYWPVMALFAAWSHLGRYVDRAVWQQRKRTKDQRAGIRTGVRH